MTPRMEVEVLEIAGVKPALLGLGLPFGKVDHLRGATKMIDVAKRLCGKGGGHDKYLESIMLWLDVKAPRYWWAEADTYRISSKQSESTMHTIRRGVDSSMFENKLIDSSSTINALIQTNTPIEEIKSLLPEGFLQRRIWCLSLKTYVNIRRQRMNHKLPHWKMFIRDIDRVLLRQPILGEIWEHFIKKEDN